MEIKELLSGLAYMTVFGVMLSMGMELGFSGMILLWQKPGQLIRAIAAAFVIVPLVAMLLVKLLPLPFTVRAGIAAIAVVPGGPFTYRKMLKGLGNPELAGSLQATMALLCIVLVPVWFWVISTLYLTDVVASPVVVGRQILMTQGIPLLIGAAIAHWLPDFVEEFNEPLNRISSALLVGVVLLVLAAGFKLVLQAGPLVILAVVLMAAAALISGHYLGGTTPRDR